MWRHLCFGGGEPSANLFDLVHPALRVELRTAIFRARQSNTRISVSNIAIQVEDEEVINLHVQPMKDTDAEHGYALVIFERKNGEDGKVRSSELNEPLVRHLEEELTHVKEQLSVTVEQYEVSNEELKAANEELQAMNEEVRSTAEELETSNSDLQLTVPLTPSGNSIAGYASSVSPRRCRRSLDPLLGSRPATLRYHPQAQIPTDHARRQGLAQAPYDRSRGSGQRRPPVSLPDQTLPHDRGQN